MPTTTLHTLRADFRTTIEAIAPAHSEYGYGWAYLPSADQVPGASPRCFSLECGVAEPVMPSEGGIWGDGQEHVAELRVWTSYAGIGESHDDSIISDDARQLFIALDARKEPALDGLWYVRRRGWEEGDRSEPGSRFGAHVFEIHYHAASTA